MARAAAAALAIAHLVACGDDTFVTLPGQGGGGGAAATTTSSTTSGTATTATTTTGAAGGSGGAGDGGGGRGGGGGSSEGGAGGAGGEAGGGGTCDPVGAGGAGGEDCTPITAEGLELVALAPGERTVYRAPLSIDLGCGGDPQLFLELYGASFGAGYDGEAAGTFDLGAGNDASYATCSRCFTAGNSAIGLFQAEGTLAVDPASTHLADGALIATVSGLVLVEALFDPDTGASFPVAGGACFTLARAELLVAAPDVPPGWQCPDEDWGAGDGCDCACGAYDPDCDDPTQAIYFCGQPHFPGDGPSCLPDGTCSNEGGKWTCDELWYGDGECDCGCGIQDFDCSTTDDDTECQWCVACDPNALEFACFGVVDPDDTTVCDD